MGRLTNLNPFKALTESDMPSGMATEAEVTTALNAHVNAADPHLQYLLLSEGDARYRQIVTQTFTSTIKGIGLSSGAVNQATAFTVNKTGLEAQAADSSSAAYISFHRPNIYGCHFGLDTNNTLTLGGWSFGAVNYKIWHELYGTPVWQTPSDSKVKKNVRPVVSGLNLILNTKPVSFQYNNLLRKELFGDKFQREKIHYGFLADDFPLQDLVAERDGYLGLDYIEVIPFLCRAVQELQAQINDLKNKIELSKD